MHFARIERLPQPLRFIVKVPVGLVLLAVAIIVFDVILPTFAMYALIIGIPLIFLASGTYWAARLLRRGIHGIRRTRL